MVLFHTPVSEGMMLENTLRRNHNPCASCWVGLLCSPLSSRSPRVQDGRMGACAAAASAVEIETRIVAARGKTESEPRAQQNTVDAIGLAFDVKDVAMVEVSVLVANKTCYCIHDNDSYNLTGINYDV